MNLLTPDVLEVTLAMMEGLRCPRAVTVSILIRYGMWSELLQLDLQPSDYIDADSYRRAAAATKLLSKLEVLVDGLDPEKAALDKWWAAEKLCFQTNNRLSRILESGLTTDPQDLRIIDTIGDMKKWMTWLIGSAPPVDFDGVFGPGATMSDHFGRTTVPHKLSSIPTMTSDALFYLVPWTGTRWSSVTATLSDQPQVVQGNQYFQVPKTARTNRSCAKEPSLNAYYQRGAGAVMSRRLGQRGIAISPFVPDWASSLGISAIEGYDAASGEHQRQAMLASLDDSMATIDLSSASDTICTALVRHVLPPRWFDVLNDLRCPKTLVKGKWVLLEKFSSMGNGFTFELETAIFTSAVLTVAPWLTPGRDLFVFGDDIICPREVASDVTAFLNFLGFTLNREKSFISSDFKESCGGDFYRGEAVRPYYLKELPNEPQDFIAMANGIRRLANQDGRAGLLHDDLRAAWFRCLDNIPRHIRECHGPEQLGDLVIHDEERFWKHRDRANCVRYIRVYRPIGPSRVHFGRFCPNTQMASALYGIRFVEPKPLWGRQEWSDLRTLATRGPVVGYKVGWIPFS